MSKKISKLIKSLPKRKQDEYKLLLKNKQYDIKSDELNEAIVNKINGNAKHIVKLEDSISKSVDRLDTELDYKLDSTNTSIVDLQTTQSINIKEVKKVIRGISSRVDRRATSQKVDRIESKLIKKIKQSNVRLQDIAKRISPIKADLRKHESNKKIHKDIVIKGGDNIVVTKKKLKNKETFTIHQDEETKGDINVIGSGIGALRDELEKGKVTIPATAISIIDAGVYYTSENVEGALQEIGAGTTLDPIYLRLDGTNGPLIADGTNQFQVNTPASADATADSIFTSSATTQTAIVVQALPSQTANLLTWQDENGNPLSGSDEKGILFSHGGTAVTNVFLGADAGNIASTATSNIGIGQYSLSSNTTGVRNVAMGVWSLKKLTTGEQNFALGAYALSSLVEGSGNVAIGYVSMSEHVSTISSGNVAIGFASLRYNTTGIRNVAIGANSGRGKSAGGVWSQNTFVGYSIALNIENGCYYNSGIGSGALAGLTTGDHNIGIGRNTANSITTGNRNTVVGNGAGQALTTTSDNVMLGYAAGGQEIGDHKLYIANTNTTTPLIYGEFDTPLLKINAELHALDNISVGTASPSASFSGVGDIYATSGIKAMEGLYSEAVAYGAGLEVADNSQSTTYTNIAFGDATLTAATQLITDTHGSFDSTYIGQFLKVISSDPSFTGATGEIVDVPSSTTLVISFGTAGGDTIVDATDMSFVIYPEPICFIGDNGDVHYCIGEHEDASFKVCADISNNDHAVHFVAKAGIDGNVGLDLEYDADTKGGTAVLHLNYDVTAFASADTLGTGMDVVINQTGASAGDVHVIDVALADPSNSAVEVEAVVTHQGVDPIAQYLGEPANLDTAFSYTPSAYTDRTVAFNSAGTDVQIFVNDDDFILLGSTAKWDEINVLNAIDASHSIIPTFHFIEDDGDWIAFTPADDSNGFSQNGTIRFESGLLATWGQRTINEVTGSGDNIVDYYWIKITRTRKVLPTSPTEDTIQITTLGAKHSWDKEGRLAIKTYNQSSEPDTSDIPAGKFCFWTDTDDSKLYICYNHGGTIKTVEMT